MQKKKSHFHLGHQKHVSLFAYRVCELTYRVCQNTVTLLLGVVTGEAEHTAGLLSDTDSK